MPSAPRLTATDLRFDGPHGPRLGPLSVDWGPGLHAITGDEGCGKDSLWAPFLWAVCGPSLRNRGLVDGKSINSRWGYALESEIMILNELKEPEASERRALANSLKPIIAAPPDTLTIERKGLHPYDMVNRVFVLAFTNHQVSITLETQDRRWFCVWSDAPKMTTEEGEALWSWYKAGGMARVAKWLAMRDVSAFNPKAKCLSGPMSSNGPAASGSKVASTVRRCSGLSSATGSSSVGTHHTSDARRTPGASPARAGKGSKATGPWRVKRSNAAPAAMGAPPAGWPNCTVPTQAVWR